MSPASAENVEAVAQILDTSLMDAYTWTMKQLDPVALLGKLALGCGIFGLLGVAGGCSRDGYVGPVVRVAGSFNGWDKGNSAPTLHWDGGAYRGSVEMPGDTLQFELYSPTTSDLFGGAGPAGPVPGTLRTADPPPMGTAAQPVHLNTPLFASYQVVFDPVAHTLHADFDDGAEDGMPDGPAALITALRGSDNVSQDELARRAATLKTSIQSLVDEADQGLGPGAQLPLQNGKDENAGLTWLYFGQPGSPDLSLVGDFNNWTAMHDPMQVVLDGSVAYIGRVVQNQRLQYRFDVHGQRQSDSLNPEVVWDGAYLPSNLSNILGGNVGDFNSVARATGYVEQGSRLRHLTVQRRDVFVYLPAHYGDMGQPATYPLLLVHDGKDALVRGQYDQVLDKLIARKAIASVVAVFVAAQSDASARLSEFAHFPDPYYFSDIQPQAHGYENLLALGVLPEVMKRYRVDGPDKNTWAMLGIDMAGVFSVYWAWRDPMHRFTRVASQSGRFDWGGRTLYSSPYSDAMQVPGSGTLTRLSFDWANGDQFQVGAIHDSTLQQVFGAAQYPTTKTQFGKQGMPLPLPNPTVWDNWRSRLAASLTFLLGQS